MLSVKRRRGGNLTRKIVTIKKLPLGRKVKNLINSTQQTNLKTIRPLDIPSIKPVSIRRLPTEISTGTLIQPARPRSVGQVSNTRKLSLPRAVGSRNIFKSMKNKEIFQEKLKNIYGSQSNQVYEYWTNLKNGLWQNVKNRELNLRKSKSSFNTNNTENFNSNSNQALYKEMAQIYGKNFAEFEDYIMRSRNVGIQFPFHVKHNIVKNP
jgi:hypothetical protein